MKRIVGCLVLGLLATGCPGAGPVEPVFPAEGEVVTWMPLDLALDLSDQVSPDSLEVTLNGHDVTAEFVIDAPVAGRMQAHALDVWGPGFVLPGPNLLEVRFQAGLTGGLVRIAFETAGDPYADAVTAFAPGPGAGFGASPDRFPGVVLGPPLGLGYFAGTLDVLSLGSAGTIDLAFVDNVVVDGPGVDFTVFENAFLQVGAFSISAPPFAEPAVVSVSQDGQQWSTFPCALHSGPFYPGCAGVHPVAANADDPAAPHASVPTLTPVEELVGLSVLGFPTPPGAGGDSFDLADLGLSWIRYVRIQASDLATGPEGEDNQRFDLDAVAAVSSAPADDADGNGIPDAVE